MSEDCHIDAFALNPGLDPPHGIVWLIEAPNFCPGWYVEISRFYRFLNTSFG